MKKVLKMNVRFWNEASECVMVNGKYINQIDMENGAYKYFREAIQKGAVGYDIDNEYHNL